MVKELVGEGQYYRRFLEEKGINLHGFARLYFRQSAQDEEQVLKKLSSFPDFDEESFRIINVVDSEGSTFHLVLVPKGCPRLRDSTYISTGELPNPEESFLVDVRVKSDTKTSHKFPILASDLESAHSIAMRKYSDKTDVGLKYLEAHAELVSPHDWVQFCRHLIFEKGEDLPDFILRFANLRECQEEARRIRSGNLPSTIMPRVVR